MRKLILSILLVSVATLSFGQSAKELNQQSKELLSKGDTKNAIVLVKKLQN